MTSKSKLVNLTFHKLEVNWFLTGSHIAWCLDDLAPLIDTIEALSRAKLAMNPVHSFAVLSVPFLTDHRGKSLVEWCEYVPGSNASIHYNPKCDYANCEFHEEAILCSEHLQRCVLKQSYKVIGADAIQVQIQSIMVAMGPVCIAQPTVDRWSLRWLAGCSPQCGPMTVR